MSVIETETVESGPYKGWVRWSEESRTGFLTVVGPSYARPLSDVSAHVVIETNAGHGNVFGALHGGFLAGFADHAYFAALASFGRPGLVGGVTIDLTMQYIGSGAVGPDLMAQVDLLRETGRLLFMRLQIFQNDQPVAASSATIRKPSSIR